MTRQSRASVARNALGPWAGYFHRDGFVATLHAMTGEFSDVS